MRESKELLRQVLAIPTAPMHEHYVIGFVRSFARAYGLHCCADRFGNLFVSNQRRRKPQLVVMAHMDHPGVEVTRMVNNVATVRIRGGLDREQVARAKFCFYPNGADPIRGRGIGAIDKERIKVRLPEKVPRGAFGMLDIPPVTFKGDQVRARVIDNLANVATILDWLRSLRRSRTSVQGIFTRGEEIGFKGAAALVRGRLLRRDVPLIVLEASSAKVARVAIGGGPVLRVGDRLTNFDPRIDIWMRGVAERVVRRDKAFAYQRALMSGGAMEASVYVLEGLMVGALALPLGNYHNKGPRGPAPEYISWRDWLRMQQLLRALAKAPSVQATVQKVKRQLVKP